MPIDETSLVHLSRLVAQTGYRFVTPTPATIARVRARPGAGEGSTLRDAFGWSLPVGRRVLGEPIAAAAEQAGILVEEAGDGLVRSLVRLSTLEGLQFVHSAYPTTQSDAVFFGPDTYRFARAIRQHLPPEPRRVVDIGCGAGPGAIVVASMRPGATVFAVDINEAALLMTRVNAEVAGVSVQARQSNLLSGVDGVFDLVVANPPYLIDPGERAYRHGGGALGAGLSLKILEAAIERLAPGGRLILYTGAAIVDGEDGFRTEAETRLAGTGLRWTYDEIDPDVFGEELECGAYARSDRIAAVLLIADKN